MRTYYSRRHRVLADGSVEVEGRWAGLTALGIGLLVLFPFVGRTPLIAALLLAAGLYLFALPPRRRVIFDRGRRRILVEHAGLFRERWVRSIPFDRLRGVVSAPAGKRRGRALRALEARTSTGTVYLLTHESGGDLARLEEHIAAALG